MIRTRHHVIALFALLLLAAPSPALAGGAPLVVQVPGDAPTVQAGLDLVAEGGEVIVAVGVYPEAIDFNGKAVTLRSTDPADPLVVAATMLVGPPFNASVVTCTQGEGPDTVLDGLTIANGTLFVGGGLLIENSSPQVIRCVFKGNFAILGGGISVANSSATLKWCTFEDNTSGNSGGGLYVQDSDLQVIGCTFARNVSLTGAGMCVRDSEVLVINSTFIDNRAERTFDVAAAGGGMANLESQPTLVGCLFAGNLAEGSGFGGGGGIYNRGSDAVISNTTFVGNMGEFPGDAGGMYSRDGSLPMLASCIFWDDGPAEIIDAFGASTAMGWSDVAGGWPGTGNVDTDPLFVDPDGLDGDPATTADNDYRLSPGSPCIDAGNTFAVPGGVRLDLDGNPRYVPDPATPDTGVGPPRIVDMGPYEFQPPTGAEGAGNATALDPL